MGKALLLIVTASVMGAGLVLFTGVQQTNFQADRQLGEHEARLLARQVALTGISEARAGVLTHPGAVTTEVQFEGATMGGTYQTTITPTTVDDSPALAIRVDSRVPLGGDQGRVGHTIEMVYKKIGEDLPGGPSDGTPDFSSYAIVMDDDLSVEGNLGVYGPLGVNADVHTNASIFLQGNNAVQGFGTYVSTAQSNPARRLFTTFSPPDNPEKLPTVQQADPVWIPDFAASDYQKLASTISDGDLTLNGTFVLGTRQQPLIWYVAGDLTVASGTELVGYGIFLVDGDIRLAGNFTTSGAVGNESNLAFYTSGSVSMSGTVEVFGQFLARQNLTFSGTSRLHGSIAVGGTVVWDGTPSVYYREASDALITPIWPELGPTLAPWEPVNYREWASRSEATPEA